MSILFVFVIAAVDVGLTISLVGDGIGTANPIAQILLVLGAMVYIAVRMSLLFMCYGTAIHLDSKLSVLERKETSVTFEGTSAVLFFAHLGIVLYWMVWATT